jgi:hypothetical protein
LPAALRISTGFVFNIYPTFEAKQIEMKVEKELEQKKKYFFIDESGDPSFYAKKKKILVGEDGFQPILLIGMIEVEDKKTIRRAVLDFQARIKSDPLYNTLPCVTDPKGWYLHANNDSQDIRSKFIEFIRDLPGFKTFITIGRKRLHLFHSKHNVNEDEFYFDLVHHLLKGRLNDEDCFYQVFLSARGKNTQARLKYAINKALEGDNEKRKTPKEINYNCEILRSKDTPELVIIDYLMWALQRYILKNESRYYAALKDKFDLIIDLYDFESNDGKANYYSKENYFSLENASPFRTDGYVDGRD